ncbi:S26 family signal peptidase [Catenuloplanes atrovinosus]|uniref:Signal peptidase I n=1 Tax=Catenuloplanes atrovinosus TaxID=137266 RepID=A0AAE3YQZ5_9ACTN|nr:S26 family signal peptidase [Catenuloplanes atrovinosus]MDR7277075.1 signal peptidase I [Catenuloplanes atrovinosus]
MLAFLLVACVLLAVAAGWARRSLIVVTVTGSSMQPLIAAGSRVLVRRTGRCRTGDVVMFRIHDSGPPMVKRVVATAGEPVPPQLRTAGGPDLVPAGRLLVLGTAPDSMDSRQLGFLTTGDVVGVVLRRAALPVAPRTG